MTTSNGIHERTLGVTHAGSGAGPCAGGAMQRLALNVDTIDDLLAIRDREHAAR